ncbi:MAG: M6 family metalloprotease domain-containing protein [Paludibacteraceae bacterium]|nr:M6 family metalloprotease domain-containing protein [Paludibacteraceae bacterium]
MKHWISILLLCMAAIGAAQELRVPARRTPVTRHQPNGDSVTVLLRGDEWKHWMITLDGWQVRENDKGVICYLQQPKNRYKDNNATVSKKQAHNAEFRKFGERCWLKRHGVLKEPIRQAHLCPPRIAPNATAAEREQIMRHFARTMSAATAQTEQMMAINTPRTFPRVPVILVNFKNLTFSKPGIRAQVDSMFNAKNYSTWVGESYSVSQYFAEQSDGQYTPIFDIYGPVTVDSVYSYYGKNKSSSTNSDSRPGHLVTEACKLMNDSLDFSQYDLNGDSKVDMVYIICAGPPASDRVYISKSWIKNPDDLIWPHYGTISKIGCGSNPKKFDNTTVEDYEISCELDGYFSYNAEEDFENEAVLAGIGVPCHEFSHGMGLPDTYKTCAGSWKTLGMWDLMDYGCYNGGSFYPAGYTAYERWFMGWKTPRLINSPENVTLQPLTADNSESLLISTTGTHNMNCQAPNPATFYLLENRQQVGSDYYLDGHGLLIYKIQFNSSNWTYNNVNNTSDKMGIDLLEADGLAPQENPADPYNGFNGKEGDAFPTGATSWTLLQDYPITDITENNGVVSFKFKGGATTDLPTMQPAEGEDGLMLHRHTIYIRKGNRLYNVLGHEVHFL